MQRPPAPAAIAPPTDPDLPRHIGIIMDGNGRWARGRHLPRVAGHRAGVRAIRPVMEACHDAGVDILTLYAFSTENWSRPRHEVSALMQLFGDTIDSEVGQMHAEGIQVRVIGDRTKLSPRLQAKVHEAEQLTSGNGRAILNIGINYGGRHEIVAAVRDLAAQGHDLRTLDERSLSDHLYTAGLPDPDLIIRTAGEMRISNFMLWQAAYAEIYVSDALWPDFGVDALAGALRAYARRDRRFGAVVEAPLAEPALPAPASL